MTWCIRSRGRVNKFFESFFRLCFHFWAKCGDRKEVIPTESKEHVEDDDREVDEDDQGKKRLYKLINEKTDGKTEVNLI